MPDAAVGRIADAGNRLLAICRKNLNWYMIPPVEFEVADAFLQHKTNLDKVPGLIDQGYRATVKRYENDLRDDRNTPTGSYSPAAKAQNKNCRALFRGDALISPASVRSEQDLKT